MNRLHHSFLASIGSTMLMLTQLGCGGVEPTIRQQPTSDRPGVPAITAARLQQCVKEHGHQLAGGSWAFSPQVQVDQEGYVVDAHAGEIPKTAPDLAACTRDVMRSMAIPGWIFDLPQSAGANEPTTAQRTNLGSPAVVVVVVVEVALAELVLEAGAFTVVFAMTVQVVDKVADDVAEAVKKGRWYNKCLTHYTACMATRVGDTLGNHWKASVCNGCYERCQTDQSWPAKVGERPCNYWERGWGE